MHKDVDENIHDRQCAYNVILRRVSVTCVAVEKEEAIHVH